MIKYLLGGGLALVAGVGAVTYDQNGTATVKITDKKTGVERTVKLKGDPNGPTYSCPSSVTDDLEASDIRAGRVKITLRPVSAKIRKIERRYPNSVAPGDVVKKYKALVVREKRLIKAFNNATAEHNATLKSECR